MACHEEEEQIPRLTSTILSSFKDCLSRNVVEAIQIHFSKDELHNSKTENKAKHISRVVVEEEEFERNRKARQEELKDLEEKRNWEKFKLGHKNRPKRKIGEENTIPVGWRNQYKELSRMGVLAPRSAHMQPSAKDHMDNSGNLRRTFMQSHLQ